MPMNVKLFCFVWKKKVWEREREKKKETNKQTNAQHSKSSFFLSFFSHFLFFWLLYYSVLFMEREEIKRNWLLSLALFLHWTILTHNCQPMFVLRLFFFIFFRCFVFFPSPFLFKKVYFDRLFLDCQSQLALLHRSMQPKKSGHCFC